MKSLSVHHHKEARPNLKTPDPHQDIFSKTTLGFWIYLMTDCILFGTLFATYAVLYSETFGGPTSQDIFSLKTAFIETLVLLLSSLTCGLATLAALKDRPKEMIGWLLVTLFLGLSFLFLEISEFRELIHKGHSWTVSAFLSSFFTLVGTHGLHITAGLVWIVVLLFQLSFIGIEMGTFRRLVLFNLFWHFLDLVWIFIFTFVYLVGVL